jgi:hypothetical protein
MPVKSLNSLDNNAFLNNAVTKIAGSIDSTDINSESDGERKVEEPGHQRPEEEHSN